MSKINTSNLKHFERIEENDIFTYVADHNSMGHISVFGFPELVKQKL